MKLHEMALADEHALDVLVDVLLERGELAPCEHVDEQRAIALAMVGVNTALLYAMQDEAVELGDESGYGDGYGDGTGDGIGCGDGDGYGNGYGDDGWAP